MPEAVTHVGSGKVRELYEVDDDRLLLVASDRISTFDVVLPTEIPDKGRVLTGLSAFWFARTRELAELLADPFALCDAIDTWESERGRRLSTAARDSEPTPSYQSGSAARSAAGASRRWKKGSVPSRSATATLTSVTPSTPA